MKIETNSDTDWLLTFWVLAALLVLISAKGCSETEQTKREAITAGLMEKLNIGKEGTTWQKP